MQFLAETGTSTVSVEPFVSALTSAITPAQLIEILASVVGVGMAFVLMWFGVRKAVQMFTAAVFGGRIRV